MKTAIKLGLLYLAFQLAAALITVMVCKAIVLVQDSPKSAEEMALLPSMLLTFIFVVIYLWKAGYISKDKETWSAVSAGYLILTVTLTLSFIILNEFVLYILPPLPDFTEDTFHVMQSSWLGILSIAALGPVVEELVFRGGATKALLRNYKPAVAIVVSGLIFGIVHLNPPQIVGAGLSGIVMAWLYYKTGSLIPVILMHIVNNSMAVMLGLTYPDVDYIVDLTGEYTYYMIVIAAAVVFVASIYFLNKRKAPQWHENQTNENFNIQY